jgi:hypothetical protein
MPEKTNCRVATLFFLAFSSHLLAQSASSEIGFGTPGPASQTEDDGKGPGVLPAPVADDSAGRQTKRILGILPNFEAVSANTSLPPLSPKQKFWLSTEGTFDYSSFISVGIQAAVEQATNTYPEFHHGAGAYVRYYWHTYTDAAVENYLVGAILPAITHEDPRYYTLYRGGFLRRTGYAISRLCITKTDKGARTFNFSEALGSGMAAEISSRYYPAPERRSGEILERWLSQLLNDGVGNMVEEFWPDINHKLFHKH